MSSPFPVVDATASGYPLLESRTELIAAGVVESGSVDTIDMLPMRISAKGPGGVTTSDYYTAIPPVVAADTRNLVLWSIFAEGASGIPAPGELVLTSQNLDPAAVGTPESENYVVKRIVIPGPAFHFSLATAENGDRPMHSGQFVCTSRFLHVIYLNGSVAQTRFNLGVYVRPLV